LLEQLTQTLDRVAGAELGELVEEQDAVMGKRSRMSLEKVRPNRPEQR
jgi:hypothetical protein